MRQTKQNMSSSPTETIFITNFFIDDISKLLTRILVNICSQKNNVNVSELNRLFVCQLLIINESNLHGIHEGYEIAKNLHFHRACQIFQTRNGFEALSQRATVSCQINNLSQEIVVYYTAKRRIYREHFI